MDNLPSFNWTGNSIKNLILNDIPEKSGADLTAGAMFFEISGGLPGSHYWKNKEFDIRDEYFVILNAYLSSAEFIHKFEGNNEWKKSFDVSYLFQVKLNMQSALSLELLTRSHCYADAFTVIRSLLSRVNFLILFALNPELYDEWLKNPKDEKFLDGHVREELANQGIYVAPHLYELSSEIIHGQGQALSDIGYFEKGVFPEIFAIYNQIFVISKFIFGMMYYTFICMTVQDFEKKEQPEELKMHLELFDWLQKNYLLPNRSDHMYTILAEDRFWEKIGKNKYNIGGLHNFEGLKSQIEKFHRSSGQEKKLGKKYNT